MLLIILGVIAAYYIYPEVQDYVATESKLENEDKLLKTNSFLAQLYEAESLSKLALQARNKSNFVAYAQNIDSITADLEELKKLTESKQQQSLLDSLHSLLDKKVNNINALRTLRIQNQTGTAIDSGLKEFDKLEESLGLITPEILAPNLGELSPKAQDAIKKLADYLNANVPENDSPQQKTQRTDSILRVSKNILKEVAQENTLNENSLAKQEATINSTDAELSQQLRVILSSFEKEIMMNSLASALKKESLLKRSKRLALIAALLGFLVVGIFTFILNKDFWKASLLREKLEKEKQYSESLLQSREQLIATVSHDLRTPIQTITGYSTLIEESSKNEKEKEYVAHIKSATTYVNNLVNDLLDFSQLEAGKLVTKNTSFRLDCLIRECARNIASQYEEKNIELSLDLDASFQKPIISDAFRIRQIISNLLGNAFKFTENGLITLVGKVVEKQDSPFLLLDIQDTGIGISEEKQELIFKEFTQAEADTEKKYGGYGLGLTITKKLTALLKGSISLKSEIGKGSTFSLKIPFLFDLEPSPSPLHNDALQHLSILVFDDDASFLKLIGEMLRSEGIDVRLYADFNTYPNNDNFDFDVVLTDIEMPTVTGYELISRITSGTYPNYRNQPILAMTGRRDLPLEHFTKLGFSHLLRKPFSKTQLLQKLGGIGLGEQNEQGDASFKAAAKTDKGYSLDTLYEFLGDDQKALNEILNTFKNDTLHNTVYLENAVKSQDIVGIRKIAHKMLPMFRQLQVMDAIPILETFEQLVDTTLTPDELHEQFEHLRTYVQTVLKAMAMHATIHPNRND